MRLCLAALILSCAAGLPADTAAEVTLPEPSVEVARRWWPDFENVWTPIGWKDHFLRFNVLYNGMVICQSPQGPYKAHTLQLTFKPSANGVIPRPGPPEAPYPLASRYGPVGNQGWNNNPTPVLWTEWRQEGVVLRKEIFAHTPGAGPVGQAVEPLYAWIRLSIREIEPGRDLERYHWLVKINQAHLARSMERQDNLKVLPDKAALPHKLRLESITRASRGDRLLIQEENDRVLLGLALRTDDSLSFVDQRPQGRDVFLKIEMPAIKGAYVDLLLPRVPDERDAFNAELKLGYDRALREADAYWSQLPDTAARIDTPEDAFDQAVRHGLKMLEVMAIRNPDTGQYGQYLGSWHYEALWITPVSMNLTMMLDAFGHHAAAEKYLEVFRETQGSRPPPGDAYKAHPGYLATPKFLTAIDWLSDHGAILHAVCNHALVTGDQAFIERWLDAILKACDFTCDHIAVTGHGGVEGILPPAVATDRRIQIQAVWNDGWHYKGLTTAVRLLQRINHPRANEFAAAARNYKAAFVAAMRESARHTSTWTDNTGRQHHLVPTALPDGGDATYPFYLDTGPLFLVYAGLMDADDPLMRSALKFFREGPNTRTYDINGDWAQPVCLHHEISSCEPCYSWNVFHAHQTGDRYKYLEGMYSLLVGTLSSQTYIGCEHRGGISGTLCSASLPLHLARLAVIDDQLRPGELHLLRMVPLAWLKSEQPTVFERIATEYGPVTMRFQLDETRRRLNLVFQPQFRHTPGKILLHVPPVEGLARVAVNDRVYEVQPNKIISIK